MLASLPPTDQLYEIAAGLVVGAVVALVLAVRVPEFVIVGVAGFCAGVAFLMAAVISTFT